MARKKRENLHLVKKLAGYWVSKDGAALWLQLLDTAENEIRFSLPHTEILKLAGAVAGANAMSRRSRGAPVEFLDGLGVTSLEFGKTESNGRPYIRFTLDNEGELTFWLKNQKMALQLLDLLHAYKCETEQWIQSS